MGICLSCCRSVVFFFSSRRRHTRFKCDWSSDVCSSDLDPARPTSPYGESKIAVDTTLTEFCRMYGFGAVSLRYFTVAGAFQGPDGRWLGERPNPETPLIPNVLAAATPGPPRHVFAARHPPPAG